MLLVAYLEEYAYCLTEFDHYFPPAYYAHLAAFRGRYYDEQGSSPAPDGTSVVGGDAAAAGDDPPACRRLPQIKENVKEVMFFC